MERAVLLAPALSPRYDLTAALRAVRREMVVFWSPLDVVILGAGTRLFGTIDRVRTVGAGLVGFAVPGPDEPDAERRRQYAKLRQVRWRPRMVGLGHLGGHFGPDHPAVPPELRRAAASRGPGGVGRIAARVKPRLGVDSLMARDRGRYPNGPGIGQADDDPWHAPAAREMVNSTGPSGLGMPSDASD